jgi:outer membrane protein OmpA-like peptidoglycan-associated protein
MRIALLFLVLSLTSCRSLRNPKTGESLGEKGGSLLGAIVGDAAGNEEAGAIIGTSLGGATGAALLKSIENQKRELAGALPDAKVNRLGDTIRIELNNKFLFAANRTTLKKEAPAILDALVANLLQYKDSKVYIASFTDSRGSEKQNFAASARRATNTSIYLNSKGINAERIRSVGLGEAKPIQSNTTEAGRAANRRLEFIITR